MQHIGGFSGGGDLRFGMNVGEDGDADFFADVCEGLQARIDARAASVAEDAPRAAPRALSVARPAVSRLATLRIWGLHLISLAVPLYTLDDLAYLMGAALLQFLSKAGSDPGLTAIGEKVNEMTSPLYGADAYVDKPFDFGELETKIATVISKRKKNKGL